MHCPFRPLAEQDQRKSAIVRGDTAARRPSPEKAIMPPMTKGFAAELARYGPDRTIRPADPATARVYCGRLARGNYENFSVASALLPRPLLRHFHAVYVGLAVILRASDRRHAWH